jgi:hypothetical protein
MTTLNLPLPETLAMLQAHSVDYQIAALNQWCEDNYEEGASTMCECWDRADYARLLADYEGSVAEAFAALQRLASVYGDREADARYHRSQA